MCLNISFNFFSCAKFLSHSGNAELLNYLRYFSRYSNINGGTIAKNMNTNTPTISSVVK